MTDNNNAKPPAIKHIPEMPVEERIKYISDDMIYNEEELAFIRTRDEVVERAAIGLNELSTRLEESLARDRESLARMDESLARGRESLARGRESLAKLDALIAELEGKQNSK